jgi:hypothetical protein
MKHSMCLHAYKTSLKYKFDDILFRVAEETNKKYVRLFVPGVFDDLYINCCNGQPYFDIVINNPRHFICHPIWDGDSVDPLHGFYLRRLSKKTNNTIAYPGAPKFIDYLSKEINAYDSEFKLEVIEDTADKYTVRVSI